MLAILPASSVLGRALAVTLAGGMAQPPTEPAAAPAKPDPAAAAAAAVIGADVGDAPADADPSIALAHARFDKGLAAYEAGDYAGAAEQWTEAYSLMADVPALVGARHVLAFDLAQAQMRAYDTDGERHRLLASKEMLDQYVAWVDRPAHTMSAAEREDRPRAIEMLARIDLELRPLAPPVVERPVAAKPTTPRYSPPPRNVALEMVRARDLIIGGSVMLGLGVAAGIAAIPIVVKARDVEQDYVQAQGGSEPDDQAAQAAQEAGKRYNQAFIATLTGAAVLTVIGVPLLATGLAKRRRLRYMPAPAVSRTHVGLQVRFAF